MLRFNQINTRNFSKYLNKDKTAKAVRQKFLDYFINEHNHTLVKSSPVVPFCDPTVAFVNAGMNQFKGVFLGNSEPPHQRVVNSQKCIRVGGKHNDLNVVGTDGYHHTFFEMLGNWSFGNYFKKEACTMAWNLLTREYKIDAAQLYVTYFKGDEKLGLSPDVETMDIWRTIGVPKDRILPFGSEDNFWEMGNSGPCGPCTEIHFDHLSSKNRANLVNKGLHDLTELWNIVFIEYNRNSDGSIATLPKKHIDTGMGFERLVSALQEKTSNYNTDNFTYLLKAIHKICGDIPQYGGTFGETDWNHLDTSYRILADHARMVTVCLADGMIPEQNQKLRRVLRKAFIVSENFFKREKGLLKELSNYVIDNLGPVYPEMERNVKQIHQIIDYEENIYKSIRSTAATEWTKLAKTDPRLLSLDVIETPSIVLGYKEIKNSKPKSLTEIAFKLYDTFGLDEEHISKMAQVFDLSFDPEGLQKEIEQAKIRSKEQHYLSNDVISNQLKDSVELTDVSRRYHYSKEDSKYVFEKVPVKILRIFKNLELVDEIGPETYCSLLLDRTNFYTEAGGQTSDKGTIIFDDYIFEVIDTQNCNGFVLHKGHLYSGKHYTLKPGTSGTLFIDPDLRFKHMQNHTALHLLNAALKDVKGATCQKSSKVTGDFLKIDVGIFSDKIDVADIIKIEKTVKEIIKKDLPVKIREIDEQKLAVLDSVTLIPGEIYPETGIRLLEVVSHDGFVSREPCCGTHVLNTGDIKDFCIISVKSLGRSTSSIHAVTGKRAELAFSNGVEVSEHIEQFEKTIRDNIDKPEILNFAMSMLKQKLHYGPDDAHILPVVVKQYCADALLRIQKEIKDSAKGALKELMDLEMQNAIDSHMMTTKNNQKFIVHYMRSSLIVETIHLQNATKMCPDIPVLIISYSDNMVKARCCVPKDLRNKSFNAENWLKDTVAAIFKCHTAPPKGQDGGLVCNMKAKKVKMEDWDPLLQKSLEAAKKYVEERL